MRVESGDGHERAPHGGWTGRGSGGRGGWGGASQGPARLRPGRGAPGSSPHTAAEGTPRPSRSTKPTGEKGKGKTYWSMSRGEGAAAGGRLADLTKTAACFHRPHLQSVSSTGR